MTVTININGVDVEIQLTPEQEALAVKQAKSKFEWKYELDEDGSCIMIDSESIRTCGIYDYYIEHGRYRKSQQAAEQSLARNKRANRLEALAEQLNGLTEFVADSANYYVYCEKLEWRCSGTSTYYPERVYMTKECAAEICRMLNEGEFSLDSEL
jgi:hypothetical protein